MARRDGQYDHRRIPSRPQSPSPGDCCGSGCTPCVLDIYEQELKIWEASQDPQDPQVNISTNKPALSTDSYIDCIITRIDVVNCHVSIFFLAFPDLNLKCGLLPGQHVIVQATSDDNSYSLSRPYTPISDLTFVGGLDLLIKMYSEGRMSRLVREWRVGSKVKLRGPFGMFDYKPNQVKHMSMLACGTGIAPMYQIMRHVLENEDDETRLVLVYASRCAKDILLKSRLDEFAQYWNVRIVYVLSNEQEKSKLLHPLKYNDVVYHQRINEKLLKNEIPPPSISHHILICGTKSFNQDMQSILTENLKFCKECLKIF